MSFLDNLMFWKKKDTVDFTQDTIPSGLGGTGLSAGGMGDLGMDTGYTNQSFGSSGSRGQGSSGEDFGMSPQHFQYPQPSVPQSPYIPSSPPNNNNNIQQSGYNNKDMEVVSSKLDAIKAVLDAINQRLANLERISSGEYEPRRRTW